MTVESLPRPVDALARILQAAGPLLAPVISVLGALAITAILLDALGVNPLFAYQSMVLGAVGTTQSLSDTLAKTVPITLIARRNEGARWNRCGCDGSASTRPTTSSG
jgi:hypothetical protein